MKKLELQPTEANILNTLNEDMLDRNTSLVHFIQLLNALDINYSLALDGAWGSGKTFFVKQAKLVLEAFNNTSDLNEETRSRIQNLFRSKFEKMGINPQFAVYYDAWKNDNDLDPLLSLIYHIGDSYDYFNEMEITDKNKALIELLKSILNFTSLRWGSNFVDLIKSKNILDELKNANALYTKIHEFLESLPVEKGNRLVIFIDELDRCRPDYAVRLLERIKHYFDLDNVTFIFSVNMAELSHTITSFYGQGFDSGRYLMRFFDYIIHLPEIDLHKYGHQFSTDETYFSIVAEKVAKYFNFQMRDLAHYYQACLLFKDKILKHNITDGSILLGDSIYFYLYFILPILLGIQIVKPDAYQSFIDGEKKDEFVKLMKETCFSLIGAKLLNAGESFDVKGNTVKVDTSDRVGILYDAIFKYPEDFAPKDVRIIGEIKVKPFVKSWLINIVSQLSNYSDYKA